MNIQTPNQCSLLVTAASLFLCVIFTPASMALADEENRSAYKLRFHSYRKPNVASANSIKQSKN